MINQTNWMHHYRRSLARWDFSRFVLLACLCLVVCAFWGCAIPIRIDPDGTVWNDLSRCSPGSTGCYVNGTMYCSDFDPAACDHEREHKRGMRHTEPWQRRGDFVCVTVTQQGATSWVQGSLICRNSAGEFFRG